MKLASYLVRESIKPAQFARAMGVPASTITRILSGARRPRLATAAKITAATGGAVTFLDLLVPSHHEAGPHECPDT